MAIRLITYDLNKGTQKEYNEFYAYLTKHNAVRLFESSYAIETDASPESIYAALKPYIHANDHVLVLTLTRPWDGRNAPPVIDWLTKSL